MRSCGSVEPWHPPSLTALAVFAPEPCMPAACASPRVPPAAPGAPRELPPHEPELRPLGHGRNSACPWKNSSWRGAAEMEARRGTGEEQSQEPLQQPGLNIAEDQLQGAALAQNGSEPCHFLFVKYTLLNSAPVKMLFPICVCRQLILESSLSNRTCGINLSAVNPSSRTPKYEKTIKGRTFKRITGKTNLVTLQTPVMCTTQKKL